MQVSFFLISFSEKNIDVLFTFLNMQQKIRAATIKNKVAIM